MKAIAPAPRPVSDIVANLAATLVVSLALAGCVPAPHVDRPGPPPPVRQRPLPVPPAPAADWRDVPATPGTWQWSMTALGSSASFGVSSGAAYGGGAQVVIRCNQRSATVSLLRADSAASAGGNVAVSITTTQLARTIAGHRGAGFIEVTLPARDPLLDAMAFSRGRFMLAASGTPTLYVPSYAEISRVIEDCR